METALIRDVGFTGDSNEVPFAAVRRFASYEIPNGTSVDVFGLDLDAHDYAIEAFEDVLSPHERAEVARFDRREQRRRVTISRGALRRILSGYLRTPPAEVPLARDSLGKPYVDLAAPGERHSLHVSCSRSGPYAIFAVTAGQPVGVDIEVANAENFTDQVAEIMLAPLERDYYGALARHARSVWLARAWVAKEAILKGLGCGLEMHPGSIDVAAFVGDAAADPSAWTSRATTFQRWWLSESVWGPSVVAVATRERPASLRFTHLTSPVGGHLIQEGCQLFRA